MSSSAGAPQLCDVTCCTHLAPHDRVPPSLDAPSFLTCDLPKGHEPPAPGMPHWCSACRAVAARKLARAAAKIREQAVSNVDRSHGYTFEFAPSPSAHRAEYDEEELRLTAAQTAPEHVTQIAQGSAVFESVCSCGWRSFALSTRQEATRLASAHKRADTWLGKIEALAPGDCCEFHYPARSEWLAGTVVVNGGSGYWSVRDDTDVEDCRGKVTESLYIEQVRLPGQTEAWT